MKGLLRPFKWMIDSTNKFHILEPDLLPLLELNNKEKPSFYIDPEELNRGFTAEGLSSIAKYKKEVENIINFSFIKPNEILE